MFKYLLKSKLLCLLSIILSFSLGGMDVFKGIALQLIVDTSVGNASYSFLNIFAIITVFVVLNFITYFLFQKSMYYASTKAISYLREDIIYSLAYANGSSDSGNMDILSMLNKDVDVVFNKYFIGVFSLVRIIASFILSVAYLLSVNTWLTLIILVLGSISVILPNFFIKKSRRYLIYY